MQDYDADRLTDAEAGMCAAIDAGDVADLAGKSVRADVVRAAVLASAEQGAGSQAVRIRRGTVEGVLDLEGVDAPVTLLLVAVRINGERQRGAINLRDARIRRLRLDNCELQGPLIADRSELEGGLLVGGGRISGTVLMRGARIRGALAIEGTRLGNGREALTANGLEINGPLVLRAAKCQGQVSLARARLGAGFNGERLVCRIEAKDREEDEAAAALVLDSSRIDGDFVLHRARLSHRLSSDHVKVLGRVRWSGLDIQADGIGAEGLLATQGLTLDEARVAGTVMLDGANVAKRFSAEGLEIDGGETALTARVAQFGGDVSMPRLRAIGELNLPGARVEGQLRLTEARLFGAELAIRADGLRAEGGWFLSRALIVGMVRCPAARFGNQFRMSGATVKVEDGAALLASGARFGRDVQLDQMFNTIGAVVMDQVEIAGTLDLTDSHIKSAAIARGLTEMAAARPNTFRPDRVQTETPNAPRVAARTEEAAFDIAALSLVDARVGRLTLPSRAEQRPRGVVDLSRATVGSFEDYAATWPGVQTRSLSLDGRDIDHLVLDGLTYAHLANPSGRDPARTSDAVGAAGLESETSDAGKMRLRWLEGQAYDDVGRHFKPQPWVTLASRLTAQGDETAARDIAIVQRRRARGAEAVSTTERWQSRLLDWFALYGYNPWRTVVWSLGVILFFAAIWAWAAALCSEAGCVDETLLIATARDGYSATGLARGYPDFNPLAYSIDLFFPFVDFGFDSHWRFNMQYGTLLTLHVPSAAAFVSLAMGGEPPSLITELRVTIGSLLYALAVTERMLGLILTSLAVTGFTGLLRPRH